MTAESEPGSPPPGGLDAQIVADFPDDPLLAALLSPSPPDRPRLPRRVTAPRPRTRGTVRDRHGCGPQAGRDTAAAGVGTGGGQSPAGASGTYRLIRAYAATLVPGPDGTAQIDPGAALRWLLASGTWRQAGRPAGEQRKVVLATLANMASKGHIRKGDSVADYRTHPPAYQAPAPGVVPVSAGVRPDYL